MALWWRLESADMPHHPSFHELARVSVETADQMGLDVQPVACAWRAVRVLTAGDLAPYSVTCPTNGAAPSAGNPTGSALASGAIPLVCKASTKL